VALAATTQRTSGQYAPQSATIQGILQDMYRSFTSSLETRTKEENTAQRHFEDVLATYHADLQLMQTTLRKKEGEKAEAETMLADATQAYEDTEATLNADVGLFDTTKASCVTKAQEWSTRKGLRAEELAGITEALAILTSDDARALFGKAIQPGFASFLQVGLLAPARATTTPSSLASAAKALKTSARLSHSLRLASLAAELDGQRGSALAKKGHFGTVVLAIEKLIVTLQQEDATDERHASNCTGELHEISLRKEDLSWKLTKNNARLTKLTKALNAKALERNATVGELEALRQDVVDMRTQRADENQRFLQAKEDDVKAIELLTSAKNALAAYYRAHGMNIGSNVTSLVQAPNVSSVHEVDEFAPEARLSGSGKRRLESKGVIQLLDTIIEDLQAEIASAVRNEQAAHLEFERQLAASEAVEREMTNRISNFNETIALHTQDANEEARLEFENENDLKLTEKTEEDLKPSCDWIRANLEERRKKRNIEMDALRSAKEYLKGARPSMAEVDSRPSRDVERLGGRKVSGSFLQRRALK